MPLAYAVCKAAHGELFVCLCKHNTCLLLRPLKYCVGLSVKQNIFCGLYFSTTAGLRSLTLGFTWRLLPSSALAVYGKYASYSEKAPRIILNITIFVNHNDQIHNDLTHSALAHLPL